MAHYLNAKNLTSPIMKMLIESLVFSRYIYALSAWGLAIFMSAELLGQYVWLVACGSMTTCLSVRQDLGAWLPIDQFVQYKSILAMCYQHYLGSGILFNPPIEFGKKHSFRTRQSPWFVNIPRCKTCFGQLQHFFKYKATTWWNSIPSQDVTSFRENLWTHLLDLT